jgi:hypothetical protein
MSIDVRGAMAEKHRIIRWRKGFEPGWAAAEWMVAWAATMLSRWTTTSVGRGKGIKNESLYFYIITYTHADGRTNGVRHVLDRKRVLTYPCDHRASSDVPFTHEDER